MECSTLYRTNNVDCIMCYDTTWIKCYMSNSVKCCDTTCWICNGSYKIRCIYCKIGKEYQKNDTNN